MPGKVVTRLTSGNDIHVISSSFYGTCSTAENTRVKEVVINNPNINKITLVTGMLLSVKFINSNTAANPALEILDNKGTTTLANVISLACYGDTRPGTAPNTSWIAGSVVTFVYDGLYWVETSGWDTLSFSGGTVSGSITATGQISADFITSSRYIQAGSWLKADSGAITLRDPRLDRDGTAPSSSQYSYVLGVTDKNSELVAYLQGIQYSTGATGAAIYAINEKSDGTQVNNSFGLIVAKDGTTSYSITNPEALRTALGKYTRSSVGTLDWGTNNDYLIAKSALAYWNGAYSGTTSNLAYCNKGAFGTLATKSSLAAADIPSLDAGKITSGTFDVARIPNLAASKITSGTFARARIENTAWAYLVGSASTVANGNYVRWRMVAGIVFLQVYYRSGAGLSAGASKLLGNIPANYRPSSIVESTGYLGTNNASPCDIWVETNGNTYIITATAASSKFYGTLSYPLE